jgi:hypothetical protein
MTASKILRPPGEVVRADEIACGQWIEHPAHGHVRVAAAAGYPARAREFTLCRPDGSLLEDTYIVTAGEAVMRVPAPVRPEPEPVLTEAEALADATVTLAGVARQFGLPLPSRQDCWISQDRTEDEARAIIAEKARSLRAQGVRHMVTHGGLSLELYFDGILAYRLTYLRQPAAVLATNGDRP